VGVDIPDELPYNDYFEAIIGFIAMFEAVSYTVGLQYYGPDYKLPITASNMENLNDDKYLEFVKVGLLHSIIHSRILTLCKQNKLIETLRRVEAAPGVAINTGASGMSTSAPPDFREDVDSADVRHPDVRMREDGTHARHEEYHDAFNVTPSMQRRASGSRRASTTTARRTRTRGATWSRPLALRPPPLLLPRAKRAARPSDRACSTMSPIMMRRRPLNDQLKR
jgi:hypothetical protein